MVEPRKSPLEIATSFSFNGIRSTRSCGGLLLLPGLCDGLWLSGTDGLLFLSLCMIDEPRPKASQPGALLLSRNRGALPVCSLSGPEEICRRDRHLTLWIASCWLSVSRLYDVRCRVPMFCSNIDEPPPLILLTNNSRPRQVTLTGSDPTSLPNFHLGLILVPSHTRTPISIAHTFSRSLAHIPQIILSCPLNISTNLIPLDHHPQLVS